MYHSCSNTAEIAHGQMFCIECRKQAPPPMQYLAKLYGVVEHKKRRREILGELTALYRREYEARVKETKGQFFLSGDGFVAKLCADIPTILLREASVPGWRQLSRRECEQIWGPEEYEVEL